MVGLQRIERSGVNVVKVARIDERCVDALLGEQTDDALALLIERTGCNYSHLRASVRHLILRFAGVLGINLLSSVHHFARRNTQRNGRLLLLYSPTEHGEILLTGSGCKIDKTGDAAEHRYVEQADMRDVVHGAHTAAHNVDDSRIGIDAEVLRYLVVRALDEGAVDGPHGMQSALRHARYHCYSLLLGNAHVYMLRTCLLALCSCESAGCRRACRDGNERRVELHLAQHPVAEQHGVVFRRHDVWHRAVGIAHGARAVVEIEGQSPVPRLLVLHGGRVAVTLLRVNVHDGGAVGVLHAAEHVDELRYVVALLKILVVEAPRLEPVVLARSVALAQRTQILVYSAVVLGDRHLVVVHHDDDACAQLRRLVETLERLTARERTVTDDGNDVLVRALHVARLLQTGGKTHGCGGVSHLEVVVLGAFRRRRVSRYGVHIVDIAEEASCATSKHLVRVALVADVEHELVHRRVEHVVQCDGRLNEAEVRTYVSAVLAHAVEHRRTCLVRHNVKRLYVQPFQVGWRLNLFYIHACFIFYFLCFTFFRLQSYA